MGVSMGGEDLLLVQQKAALEHVPVAVET